MRDELPVHVNRQELHSLEVPATFETHGTFDLVLVNHGESSHVHLHLDDALSEVARMEATNHYVEGQSRRTVRVTINEKALTPEAVRGRLKVATGYGARTRWIDVELVAPSKEDTEVQVDESLGKPQPKSAVSESNALLDRSALPVMALGVLALLLAIVAALVIQNTIVLVGALLVVAGVLVSLYVLIVEREPA